MTTYRLPDWMGGTEAALIGGIEEDGSVRLAPLRDGVMSNARVSISVDEVTEVKPPLPEPPLGIVVLDRDGLAWQRNTYLWLGGTGTADWAALNEQHGPLTVLVPDPADHARVLPFELLDDDGDPYFRMSAHHSGIWLEMFQDLHEVDLSGDEPYALAAAILRVVREARSS